MANFNVCLFIVPKSEAKLISVKEDTFLFYILQKLLQEILRGF
jgi:hypothetical protein